MAHVPMASVRAASFAVSFLPQAVINLLYRILRGTIVPRNWQFAFAFATVISNQSAQKFPSVKKQNSFD
jgi:hypothetical protein